MMRWPCCALIAVLTAGCASDVTALGFSAPTFDGDWRIVAPNLETSGVSCGLAGLTLHLAQHDAELIGTHDGGTLTCGPGTIGILLASGTAEGSVIGGDSVSIELEMPGRVLEGQLVNGTLSGSMTLRLVIGADTATFVGPWTAFHMDGP